MGQELLALKEYSIFAKSPKLETHHHFQFWVIIRAVFFCKGSELVYFKYCSNLPKIFVYRLFKMAANQNVLYSQQCKYSNHGKKHTEEKNIVFLLFQNKSDFLY